VRDVMMLCAHALAEAVPDCCEAHRVLQAVGECVEIIQQEQDADEADEDGDAPTSVH
jgi:hypothetical protein